MSKSTTKARIQLTLPTETKRPTALSTGLILINIAAALLGYFTTQPDIPLFYSLAQNNQQLVGKEYIFILPILAIVFGIMNMLIITILKKYDKLLLTLFSWVTTIFQALLTFALLRILFIVS